MSSSVHLEGSAHHNVRQEAAQRHHKSKADRRREAIARQAARALPGLKSTLADAEAYRQQHPADEFAQACAGSALSGLDYGLYLLDLAVRASASHQALIFPTLPAYSNSSGSNTTR